ncbi:MAG: preprotein translocase subunit YajC [Oligoflexia bacterium]|nr:preprotein translocase subunit YajC [Oligoflexia bacterium]
MFTRTPRPIVLAAAAVFALIPLDLFAQAAAPGAGAPPVGFSDMLARMLPMFAMVFFIFYFMVLRPQNKKMLDHKALIESLKKGDAVVTSGGMIGRVAAIENDAISVEIANNVKVKFEAAHIARRLGKPGDEAQAA